MPKLALTPALAGPAMCFVAMLAAPAQAQLRHTWVASNGSDSFNCDRPTPCATFHAAVSKVSAQGEVTCVDSGNFISPSLGGVLINKSITINCASTIGSNTFIGGLNTGAFIVSTSASDTVLLRGLDLDGLGAGCPSGCGTIDFVGAGVLHVDKVKINNLRGPSSGIRFVPNGAARLNVSDSTINDNGNGSVGAGILIKPRSGGSARVALERVIVNGNTFGVAADGTDSTAGINMTIADSMIASNVQDGIIATTPGGGAPIGVLVTNTKSVNNAFGIRSLGTNVTVRVKNSDITGNGTGLSFGSGGALLSAGNNLVEANGANGAFSGSVALK